MRRRQHYFKQPLRIHLGKNVLPADGGRISEYGRNNWPKRMAMLVHGAGVID